MFAMNWGMDYRVSYLFYLHCTFIITTNKVKILEETLIANNCFNVTWTNRHNLQFPGCTATKHRFLTSSLLRQIRWYPDLNRWPLPLPRTRRVKKLTDFFSKYAIIYPVCFNAIYWKICIALLCSVFANPVTDY